MIFFVILNYLNKLVFSIMLIFPVLLFTVKTAFCKFSFGGKKFDLLAEYMNLLAIKNESEYIALNDNKVVNLIGALEDAINQIDWNNNFILDAKMFTALNIALEMLNYVNENFKSQMVKISSSSLCDLNNKNIKSKISNENVFERLFNTKYSKASSSQHNQISIKKTSTEIPPCTSSFTPQSNAKKIKQVVQAVKATKNGDPKKGSIRLKTNLSLNNLSNCSTKELKNLKKPNTRSFSQIPTTNTQTTTGKSASSLARINKRDRFHNNKSNLPQKTKTNNGCTEISKNNLSQSNSINKNKINSPTTTNNDKIRNYVNPMYNQQTSATRNKSPHREAHIKNKEVHLNITRIKDANNTGDINETEISNKIFKNRYKTKSCTDVKNKQTPLEDIIEEPFDNVLC